jgi:hypothetical protein
MPTQRSSVKRRIETTRAGGYSKRSHESGTSFERARTCVGPGSIEILDVLHAERKPNLAVQFDLFLNYCRVAWRLFHTVTLDNVQLVPGKAIQCPSG